MFTVFVLRFAASVPVQDRTICILFDGEATCTHLIESWRSLFHAVDLLDLFVWLLDDLQLFCIGSRQPKVSDSWSLHQYEVCVLDRYGVRWFPSHDVSMWLRLRLRCYPLRRDGILQNIVSETDGCETTRNIKTNTVQMQLSVSVSGGTRSKLRSIMLYLYKLFRNSTK